MMYISTVKKSRGSGLDNSYTSFELRNSRILHNSKKHAKARTTEIVDSITNIAMPIRKFRLVQLFTVQLLLTNLALLGQSLYSTRFPLNHLGKLKYDRYLYRKAIRISRNSGMVLFNP